MIVRRYRHEYSIYFVGYVILTDEIIGEASHPAMSLVSKLVGSLRASWSHALI